MWGKLVVAFLILLLLSAVFSTASAWESNLGSCEQTDLEGTWSVEIWAGDPSGNQYWDQCTLTVGQGGSIEAGTYTNFMGQTADVTGGQLTISSDCVVQGTIETSSGSLDVERGGIIADQLILDKQ
jgi:hypothetical protein